VIHGKDPRSVLHAAATAYRRAIAIDPSFFTAHSNLGHTLIHLGDYERLIGQDPSASYTAAARAAARGHSVNRGSWRPPQVVANAHRLLAEQAVRKGVPAKTHTSEALRWADMTTKLAPQKPGAYMVKALTYLAMAEERRRRSEPYGDLRTRMAANIAKSFELAPESVYIYSAAARVALWNVRHGGLPVDARIRALDSVLERRDVVREHHEESVEMLILTSLLAKERAELSPGDRAAHLTLARQWRADAFALNPIESAYLESEQTVR
jgi:tetratricopeptide (TPR) repeat protein